MDVVYVIAVHNIARAVLLWGTSKEKKNLKTAVVYIAMKWQFWMMAFQQELEGVWKIFLFLPQVRTQEWLCQFRPRSVLPTLPCPTMTTNRCPGKWKKRASACSASPPPAGSGNVVCLAILNRFLLQVYSVVPVGMLGELQLLTLCMRSCPVAILSCVHYQY